jgi:hypothetical protein
MAKLKSTYCPLMNVIVLSHIFGHKKILSPQCENRIFVLSVAISYLDTVIRLVA